jgi:uncharacterized protein (DUF362 family)
MRTLSRRQLIKFGAGAAASWGASQILTACGNTTVAPTPSPTPVPTPTPLACTAADLGPPARVAAIRGTDLYAMTRSALDALGGIGTVVRPRETVFIKPNMVTLPWASSTYNPFRLGECTKPEIVIAVAEECLKAGASEVIVGDGSQMPRFDWSGATTLDGSTNLTTEAARLNARYAGKVRLVCLDVDTPAWVEIPTGISLGKVLVSSLVTQADRVISIPVAKTHKWAYLTLSLKNFIGITPLEPYGWTNSANYDRALLHQNDSSPRGFGRLFVDLAKAAGPDLALIDFSIGMEGNGPSQSSGGLTLDVSTRLGSWLLLASTDAVAADATAARVMGQESPYVGDILRMAHDAGMGAICSESIELLGARLEDLQIHWTPAQVAS